MSVRIVLSLVRPARRIAALLVPLSLAGILGGCGGGASTGPTVRASASALPPAAERFTPNYVENLSTLLYWPTPNLIVYIGPSEIGQDRSNLVAWGIGLWEKATDGRIRFEFTQDPDDEARARVNVRFVPHGSLGAGMTGSTSIRYDTARRTILRTEILLEELQGNDQLIATVAHEMGHALGLGGHSPNTEDLMYSLSTPPARITGTDLNTLKTAYAWLFEGDPGRATGRAQGSSQTLTITCPGH